MDSDTSDVDVGGFEPSSWGHVQEADHPAILNNEAMSSPHDEAMSSPQEASIAAVNRLTDEVGYISDTYLTSI